MKKLFLMLLIAVTTITIAQSVSGTVVRVQDGDTITVLDSLNQKTVVRVSGIDSPEKKQDYFKNCKEFSEKMLLGNHVDCKFLRYDPWKRSVCKVTFNNEDLAEIMIKQGLAWHDQVYDKQLNLQILEDQVRKNKIGLFANKRAIRPIDFRIKQKIKRLRLLKKLRQ